MRVGLGSFEYDVGARALLIGAVLPLGNERCVSVDQARREADRLLAEGADAIDVGDVTRWAASRDVDRLARALAALRADLGVPVAATASSAEGVAALAAAGIDVVTDASGQWEGGFLAAVAAAGASLVVTPPAAVLARPPGADPVAPIAAALRAWADRAVATGIAPHRVLLDAGAERAATSAMARAIVGAFPRLTALGFPLQCTTPAHAEGNGPLHPLLALAADSDDRPPPPGRAPTTAAAAIALALIGGVHLIRADDVREARRVVDVVAAIRETRGES